MTSPPSFLPDTAPLPEPWLVRLVRCWDHLVDANPPVARTFFEQLIDTAQPSDWAALNPASRRNLVQCLERRNDEWVRSRSGKNGLAQRLGLKTWLFGLQNARSVEAAEETLPHPACAPACPCWLHRGLEHIDQQHHRGSMVEEGARRFLALAHPADWRAAGLDLNATQVRAEPLLHYLIRVCPEAVSGLLAAGASWDIRNSAGVLAEDLARRVHGPSGEATSHLEATRLKQTLPQGCPFPPGSARSRL